MNFTINKSQNTFTYSSYPRYTKDAAKIADRKCMIIQRDFTLRGTATQSSKKTTATGCSFFRSISLKVWTVCCPQSQDHINYANWIKHLKRPVCIQDGGVNVILGGY